jgi:hypothetical protein
MPRDRCYDFLNIFTEKFSEKIGIISQTTASFCKNCDHNICFWEKRQFFRQKLENCDHNIDPWWRAKVVFTSASGRDGLGSNPAST